MRAGLPEIDAALEQYKGYPDEVLVHWGTLQQSRDQLVRTARLKVREAAAMTDPAAVAAVIERYAGFGEGLQAELANAEAQLCKLVDAARTDVLGVANRKAATVGALEAVLAKYAGYPAGALEAERAAVNGRLQDLRALKHRLCEVRRPAAGAGRLGGGRQGGQAAGWLAAGQPGSQAASQPASQPAGQPSRPASQPSQPSQPASQPARQPASQPAHQQSAVSSACHVHLAAAAPPPAGL